METSELIKFGILALIVVVVALVARRGQAHSTPAPPKKADHITEETDADTATTDVQRQQARTRARLDRVQRHVVSDDDAVE